MTTKQIKQKNANEMFLEIIQEQIEKETDGSPKEIIRFLLRRNFVRQSIINRYLVLECYEKELEKTKTKTKPRGDRYKAVWDMEEYLPLCETSIITIIHNYRYYFKENKLQLP